VLATSDLGQGLVALGFWGAALLLPPEWTLPAFMATNAALALLSQFAIPAQMALLPDLAGAAHLMPANALLQLGMLAAEGLGVLFLSPLLIKLAGVPAVGLVGALLCTAAAALVMTLPRDRVQAAPMRKDGVPEQPAFDWRTWASDLKTGWQTILHDRLLILVVLQATLAATLLLILIALLPGLLTRHLELGTENVPFVLLPGGLGFVLGAVLVGRREALLSRLGWMGSGLAGVGLSVGLLGLVSTGSGHLVLILPLVFVAGLALALVVIPARTLLQERPPAELRGRVIAAQLAMTHAASLLPLLMGGALADRIGIRPVMGLLGLVAGAVGAVGLYYARSGE
jgi:acyl-[acyl-carrier-protein]-phospholipid O-acyltransferase/long-chain-fatty-acid--[acyl-carrier-protein] ligase